MSIADRIRDVGNAEARGAAVRGSLLGDLVGQGSFTFANVLQQQQQAKRDAEDRAFLQHEFSQGPPDLGRLSARFGPERALKIFSEYAATRPDPVKPVAIETADASGAPQTEFVTPTPGARYAKPKPAEKPPGTREIRTKDASGAETVQIVADTPGQKFDSAAQVQKWKPGASGISPQERLALSLGYVDDATGRPQTERLTEAQASSAERRWKTDTAIEGQDVTKLTKEGLDVAALNYRKTGVMPPLGMGDKTTRQQIINRAAELKPDDIVRIESVADIATAKATYAADQSSLTKLTAQRDAITAFEHTAVKNLENFIAQAKKVTDSGSPLLNRPLRSFNEQVLGSPQMTAYNTARLSVIPEFAKILNNPNLSGQLSDSARDEVAQLMKGDATLAQTLAAAQVLLQDVKNRSGALDDQLKAIRGRMSGVSAKDWVDAGAGFRVREKK